jgi:thiol-disulfide isomerase/thioredoxin
MLRSKSLLVATVSAGLALGVLHLLPVRVEASADAPAFELEDCKGRPVMLGDFEGKPLVLNFWATWCPPCQMEIPALSSYARSNPEVSVVGVAIDSGPADHMPQLRTQLDIDYEIYAGNNAIVRAYGVRGLPTTVVIDGEGQLVATHTGPVTEQQLSRMVEKAR